MESLLGFEDAIITGANDDQLKSSASPLSEIYRLVPWLSWEEWEFVRDSLFSDSSSKINSALNRISVWRSRGTLPVVIDITASIIETQQKDPFYRNGNLEDGRHSEQMLAMLYCMTILRLVNCVVEKTRKRTAISLAEAAGRIGIPRSLIDVRHEASHRDLPALALVRDSAVKAIHWLKSYYWEPQTEQIFFQRDGTANVRKEIKSKLSEFVLCLKGKQSPQPDSSLSKAKPLYQSSLNLEIVTRERDDITYTTGAATNMASWRSQLNPLCQKHQYCSKKHNTKTLKSLIRLYSSSSSEVVFVLLESFLKAFDSSNLVDLTEDCHASQDICTSPDDWKIVITKLSKKEPEVLLMLLKEVLDIITTQETMKYEIDKQLKVSEYGTGTGRIEHLSSVFAWLVGQLLRLKPFRSNNATAETSLGMNISDTTVTEIRRKCLLVALCGDKLLMDSALHLAQLLGGSCVEKLKKFSLLGQSDMVVTKEEPSLLELNSILIKQDQSIHQATKKLELLKSRLAEGRVLETREGNQGSLGRWVVAKSWNPCPIGMLPRELGSSGHLSVLDCNGDYENSIHLQEREQTGCDFQSLDDSIVERTSCKRVASCDTYLLDGCSLKKTRDTVENETSGDALLPKDVRGCLMIDGVWKQIGEEELLTIKSRIRILI